MRESTKDIIFMPYCGRNAMRCLIVFFNSLLYYEFYD